MQSHAKVKEFLRYLLVQEPKILFNILNKLPKMGVGRKVTRITWNVQDTSNCVRPAYWTITKVIPNEDMRSGEVWGTFCHRGIPGSTIRKVRSIERKQWLLLPKDYNSNYLLEDGETNKDDMTNKVDVTNEHIS